MTSIRTHIHKGGRIVIPAKYRKAMGLHSGDEVVLILEDHEMRVVPPDQAIRQAQALVGQFVPKTRSLAKELIQDRHREVKREQGHQIRKRKLDS